MPETLTKLKREFLRKSEAHALTFRNIRLSWENNRIDRHVLKFCIISLLDDWGKYCRDLVIFSSVRGTVRGNGQVLLGQFPNARAAAEEARRTKIGHIGQEPRWHDAKEALRIAKKLAVPNSADIGAALGAMNSPADKLRIFRNHCAHESSIDCGEKLRNLIISPSFQDLRHIFEVTEGGDYVFESWIRGLQDISIAASY